MSDAVFSVLECGPANRTMARFGLSPPVQVIGALAITWVPLAILSVIAGTATGTSVRIPFFRDAVLHARFLIALPAFLLTAKVIDGGLRKVVAEFRNRDIVLQRERYESLVQKTERLLDWPPAEILVLVIAFARSFLAVKAQLISSWITTQPGVSLTPAGWWYAVVALPLAFFISGRWIWGFLVWIYYLDGVSRLDLHLIPSHPDSTGGIGFLSLSHSRFAYLLFGASVVFSANVANAILIWGHTLPEYKTAIFIVVGVQVFLVLAPLFLFSRKLNKSRIEGLGTYGRLGTEYVRDFEAKWVREHKGEEILGTSDIQSLADLANSYQVVAKMRIVPLRRGDAIKVAAYAAAPFVPLLLTMMSAQEAFKLVMSVIK